MSFGGGGGSSAPQESAEAREYYSTLSDMARKSWDTFEEYGRPQLSALAREVSPSALPGRISAAQGLATADVRQAFGSARGQMSRGLARYGVNPRSGRYMAGLRNLALGEAAATAGARTAARTGVLDRVRATRMGLLSAASGQAGQAMSGMSSAGSGLAGMASASRQAAATRSAGKWTGIGSLVGTGVGAFLAFSDRRLKTDVSEIDEIPFGLKVYSFRFRGMEGDGEFTGLMADEVERVFPDCVAVDRDGWKLVDYGAVIKRSLDWMRESL